MIKKYNNYPKKLSPEFYDIARKELISSVSQNKDIISVYEYGSINSFGLSDLDIIIIFKSKNKINFKKSDIGRKALMLKKYGTIIKTTENIFKYFFYLDKFNFKKIYGKKIKVFKPSKKTKEQIALLAALDWLPERLLRIEATLKEKPLKIDASLSILNSLGYSLKIVKNITKKKVSLKLLKDVKKLRKSWYRTKNPEKKLIDTLKKIKIIGLNLLFYYQEYLKKKKLYLNRIFQKEITTPIKLEMYKNSFISFENINTLSELQKLNVKKFKNSKIEIKVPFFLFPHFDVMSKLSGSISKNIKKRVDSKIKIKYLMKQEYRKALHKKIFLMEKNYKFLKSNKFENGLIRYGLYTGRAYEK